MNASAVPAHLRGQEVDVRWVMRELLDEQRVTREEFNVISTTPRENKELNWHPLQVVAKYRLVDRAHGQRIMDVEFLSDWLAAKSGLPSITSTRSRWMWIRHPGNELRSPNGTASSPWKATATGGGGLHQPFKPTGRAFKQVLGDRAWKWCSPTRSSCAATASSSTT